MIHLLPGTKIVQGVDKKTNSFNKLPSLHIILTKLNFLFLLVSILLYKIVELTINFDKSIIKVIPLYSIVEMMYM